MFNRGLFSSMSGNWQTPIELFRELDKEFHFNLDPCTTEDNPLGTRFYYSKEMDGLNKTWYRYLWGVSLGDGFTQIKSVFVNPPYGRKIGLWIEKAYKESQRGCTVVMLIPSRTDTVWWHRWVMKAEEIRFIKGRLKFGGAKNSAPFPSAIVVFRGID